VRSNAPATRHPKPNAATSPSIPTTGLSPAAWKPTGNARCAPLAEADAELGRRESQRPKILTQQEKTAIRALGADVATVWCAPTTTERDRKELLRTLLEEVVIRVDRTSKLAELTLTGAAARSLS
jgi:hypothetical protein